MIKAVMLDSGPLGRLTHADYSRNREYRAWLAALLDHNIAVFLPEIADYEVRFFAMSPRVQRPCACRQS